MPTRYYLPRVDSNTAAVSPATSAAWNRTGTAMLRGVLTKVKTNTSLASAASTETRETVNTVGNMLHKQWVSDPIGAQTISGTFSFVSRCGEENAAADASMQMVIRVVSGDGATVRGTLYGGHTAALTATAGAGPGAEMPTTSATRHWSGIALTSVVAQNGDRIVFELGHRHHNTITTAYGAYFTLGDATATGDCALSSGVTTTLNPWLEFSGTIADATSGTTIEAAGAVTSASVVTSGGIEIILTSGGVVSSSSVIVGGTPVQIRFSAAAVTSASAVAVTSAPVRGQFTSAAVTSASVVAVTTAPVRQQFTQAAVQSASSVGVASAVREVPAAAAVVSGSAVGAGTPTVTSTVQAQGVVSSSSVVVGGQPVVTRFSEVSVASSSVVEAGTPTHTRQAAASVSSVSSVTSGAVRERYAAAAAQSESVVAVQEPTLTRFATASVTSASQVTADSGTLTQFTAAQVLSESAVEVTEVSQLQTVAGEVLSGSAVTAGPGIFSDDFNRATGGLGSDWASASGPMTIASNVVVGGVTPSAARWVTTPEAGITFSQVTFLGGSFNGVAVAMPAYANGTTLTGAGTWYVFRSNGTTAGCHIAQKNVGASTHSVLVSNARNLVAGDVLRLEYTGTRLTAYINGVQVIGHTLASPITGQYGVGIVHGASGQTGTQVLDNWSGGNLQPTAQVSSPSEVTSGSGTITTPASAQVLSDSAVQVAGVTQIYQVAASVQSASTVAATPGVSQLVSAAAQILSGSAVTAGAVRVRLAAAQILSGSVVESVTPLLTRLAAAQVQSASEITATPLQGRFAQADVNSASVVVAGAVREQLAAARVESGSTFEAVGLLELAAAAQVESASTLTAALTLIPAATDFWLDASGPTQRYGAGRGPRFAGRPVATGPRSSLRPVAVGPKVGVASGVGPWAEETASVEGPLLRRV